MDQLKIETKFENEDKQATADRSPHLTLNKENRTSRRPRSFSCLFKDFNYRQWHQCPSSTRRRMSKGRANCFAVQVVTYFKRLTEPCTRYTRPLYTLALYHHHGRVPGLRQKPLGTGIQHGYWR